MARSWVKQDDVFAVARPSNQGGRAPRSYRVEWALLRVDKPPQNGTCICKLFNRYEYAAAPARRSANLGFRCLKLGGRRVRPRLRFISDDRLGTPLVGAGDVRRADGFQPYSGRSTPEPTAR